MVKHPIAMGLRLAQSAPSKYEVRIEVFCSEKCRDKDDAEWLAEQPQGTKPALRRTQAPDSTARVKQEQSEAQPEGVPRVGKDSSYAREIFFF